MGFSLFCPLPWERWRKNKKIKIIVKYCGGRPFEHKAISNGRGVDFHETLVFAGYDGNKLTDVPLDLNKFKILFPDLFLEE